MGVHRAAGKRLGITDEDIDRLVRLDKHDFELKEWLVLRYARDWVLGDGKEPEGEYLKAYYQAYSLQERQYVLKLLRMMRFANYFNNTFFTRIWRTDLEDGPVSCEIRNDQP